MEEEGVNQLGIEPGGKEMEGDNASMREVAKAIEEVAKERGEGEICPQFLMRVNDEEYHLLFARKILATLVSLALRTAFCSQ